MKDDLENIQTSLQDLIATAARDLGEDHEFTTTLKEADAKLETALGIEIDEEAEE